MIKLTITFISSGDQRGWVTESRKQRAEEVEKDTVFVLGQLKDYNLIALKKK